MKTHTTELERNITANEAVAYIADRYYHGRTRPHPSTIYRWMRTGHQVAGQRLRLQHERVGRHYLTRRVWVDAFFAALQAGTSLIQHPNRVARRHTHAEAVQALRAAGI